MLPGSDGEVDEAYFIFDTAHANRVLLTSRDDSGFRAVTDEMIEALADAKRIAILRLLRKRPHFSKEIADGIGVSASTASYHIDKLIAARLIHLEISRGRRFYYAINSRGVRGFLARFEAEFLGDE
jgi:DNA-binding transcriptional ArsR family regulator